MREARNYWVSFIICIVATALAAINTGDISSLKSMILVDGNVGAFLFIAWLFDGKVWP